MTSPVHIVRTASIHWAGDIARGRGTIATESGKVAAEYSYGTRFSGDPGTSPEELLAAAHAACFTMALSGVLTRAGKPPTSLDSTAAVTLASIPGGFEIPSIELTVNAVVPGLTDEAFQKLANDAKENCPLSRALRAVPLTLHATLQTA